MVVASPYSARVEFVGELIVFQQVAITVGSTPLLRELNFSIDRGEIIGLAGPNGIGKTSLLRAASGVLKPSSGSIAVAGRPLDQISRRELARLLAVVPQDLQLAFPFSVMEVVLLGRTPHLPWFGFESESDIQRARTALSLVGMQGFAVRDYASLSGGEQQLVLLARAFAQEAQLLLLDEPDCFLGS